MYTLNRARIQPLQNCSRERRATYTAIAGHHASGREWAPMRTICGGSVQCILQARVDQQNIGRSMLTSPSGYYDGLNRREASTTSCFCANFCSKVIYMQYISDPSEPQKPRYQPIEEASWAWSYCIVLLTRSHALRPCSYRQFRSSRSVPVPGK
jgi:hypothetical protein